MEEHEYLENDNPMGPMVTNKERRMVRDWIVLHYLDIMVTKDIERVERSGNILSSAFVTSGRHIQKMIMRDLQELRKEFKQRDIKVIEDKHEDLIAYHMIFSRGYRERFGMMRDVIRTEISLRLTRYTEEVGKTMSSTHK